MRTSSKWPMLLLLFGSGLCALVYQTVWIRELRLIFGASTLAISTVMAIFLGGIGFGSIYLGRYAERKRFPLKLYAYLELGITIMAAISPFLLTLVRLVYITAGGSLSMGPFFSTIFRILLAALVIGGPTFLMGGTLPALARAFETESDSNRSRLGLLYGINTIGAVAGVTLATFFLLEMLGSVSTLWAACLLNLLVAIAALLLARKSKPILEENLETSTSAKSFSTEKSTIKKEKSLILGISALSGFIFLVMELVWYRMLTPLLGGTTYSFGLILAIVLLGIGLGGWLYGKRKEQKPSLRHVGLLCGLEAFFIAIPFGLGDNLAIWTIILQSFAVYGFIGTVLGWSIIISVVVLPAAMVSGYLFPLLVGLLGSGRHKIAVQTGQVYAWNTFGVIIGSLTGGFVLIPALSAPSCWKLMVLTSLLLAVALTIFSFNKDKKLKASHYTTILISSLALLMLTATGPTAAWRHSAIGVGKANFPFASALKSFNAAQNWLNKERSFLLYETDGRESSVGLVIHDGLSFVINGKADGNAFADAATQVMAPIVGAILHPDPKTALVIGVGSGSSAGWLGSIPSMKQVDQVEIEPAILKIAEHCTPVNNNVMKNPKVKTIIADGREVLLTTKKKFDLIFSEPSNPYRAGIASLFTTEFYQAVVSRLQPGGMFSQWVQGYDINSKTLKMIYATLHSVFPSVEIWLTHPGDLLFVCSMKSKPHPVSFLRDKISQEPYSSALLKTWGVVDLEGFFAHYVAQPALAPIMVAEDIKKGLTNTDDRMYIEFGFAKSTFSGKDEDIIDNLRKSAWQNNMVRPNLQDGELDLQLVNENLVIFDAIFGRSRLNPYQQTDLQHRLESYVHFNDLSRLAAQNILIAWYKQDRQPQHPIELAMLAESMAELGDKKCLEFTERIAPYYPIDTEAILARYYLRTQKPALAFDHLSKALVDFRSNPWIIKQIISRSLNMTLDFANRYPDKSAELFDLMSKPFSVGILESERRNILVEMSTRLDYKAGIASLAQMEPHIVPWDKAVLEYRLKCYKEAKNPLAGRAKKDLNLFIKNEKHFKQEFK